MQNLMQDEAEMRPDRRGVAGVPDASKKNAYSSRRIWARRLALLFLLLFVAVTMTAQITIISNANHKCIGDGCPICKMLRQAETALKQLGSIAITLSIAIMGSFSIIAYMLVIQAFCNHSTIPVYAKIRLNN